MPVRNLPLLYAAVVAASSVGFTPAGIGTVETAIALALAHLGSDGAHALPAAVVYRAISTWLVVLIGWGVLAVLRREPAKADVPAEVPVVSAELVEAGV
jgi:putative heme transporter